MSGQFFAGRGFLTFWEPSHGPKAGPKRMGQPASDGEGLDEEQACRGLIDLPAEFTAVNLVDWAKRRRP